MKQFFIILLTGFSCLCAFAATNDQPRITFDASNSQPLSDKNIVPSDSIQGISGNNEIMQDEVTNSLSNPKLARSIEVQDHTIVGPAGMRIFNLTGQDVTLLNGQLPAGLYIVKAGKNAIKVRIQ